MDTVPFASGTVYLVKMVDEPIVEIDVKFVFVMVANNLI